MIPSNHSCTAKDVLPGLFQGCGATTSTTTSGAFNLESVRSNSSAFRWIFNLSDFSDRVSLEWDEKCKCDGHGEGKEWEKGKKAANSRKRKLDYGTNTFFGLPLCIYFYHIWLFTSFAFLHSLQKLQVLVIKLTSLFIRIQKVLFVVLRKLPS